MDFYTLFALGVVLIALEVFVASFVVIWFGLGFLLVSFVELVFPINDIVWQICFVAILSLIFLFLFRKKLLVKFSKSQREVKDNFFNEKGVGEIKNSKVFYKATYWEIDSKLDEKEFVEGEKVEVLKIHGNFATISKRQIS
ncbi:NfeD family protein [Arcobacter vandammei]|uniref:NfeD family protein n=1 Tax=Arcobacter vandammei TaxID=2782243 RepID=UPI0018E0387A|nr:nodulation efficiency protein D [Arcobacter vandammei]